MNKFAKFASVVLAVAIVASVVPSAKAETVEELQAKVAQLTALLSQLQGQLTTPAATGAYSFTKNLTIGSKGADVTALQQILNTKGFLKVAPTGYFGPATKAALVAYQASVGITPASGYFGPLSRTHFNSLGSTTPTTTPSTTTTPSPTMTATEGTLTVEVNPTPASGQNVYEGNTKIALLGLKLKATNGDVKVERVKLDLGATTALYNKVMNRVYVMDGSTVLAESALNSTTAVKDGSNYYVTLSGFNFVVSKDSTKVLTIAGDIFSTVDTTDANKSYTLSVPANGVRGKDGLGIDQYGPATAGTVTRSFNLKKTLVNSATLTLSKSGNSPKASNIVSDTNGDVKEAVVLAMDLRSEKDQIKITDMIVTSTGSATASTAYLYDGSTLVGSASVSLNKATFSNIELYVPADSTKTVTIKMDYTGATTTTATSSVAVLYQGITAQNSRGDTPNSLSGSATSETMTVLSKAPIFALSGTPTIKTIPVSGGGSTTSSNKGEYVFTVNVTAKGGDIYFAQNVSSYVSTFGTLGGTPTSTNGGTISASFTGHSAIEGTYWKLSQDTTGTLTVTGKIPETVASGSYYAYLNSIVWDLTAATGKSTTLDTDTYKTATSVSLPN